MKEEIKVLITLSDKIISVNDLYKAKVGYKAGRPYPIMYKNDKAKKMEEEIRDQCRAVDFTEHLGWLRTTKGFDLNIQFIFKTNIGKRDCSNACKCAEDCWVRFVKEDLGIENYDDAKHNRVILSKSIIPKADHEYICLQLTPSTFNTRFDQIEKVEKIFLGGTCAESKWREELQPELQKRKINFFNPVVENWTPECQQREEEEKKICNCHLFLITPEMKGIYSIAEIVDSVYKHLDSGFVWFAVLEDDRWPEFQKKSLQATIDLVGRISQGHSNISCGWVKSPIDVLEWLKDGDV